MDRRDDSIVTAWQARREGRHSDAERGLLEAVAASRRAGVRLDLIRALKGLAHVWRDADDADGALPLYEEAVALSREEDDPFLLAHTVRHLGDLHREAGRLPQAERCYDEALAIYRGKSNPPALDFANAVRPLALLKSSQGDDETARRLFAEARKLYEAAGIVPAPER